jgi:tyrosyl-DNA phosphodiesterase 2
MIRILSPGKFDPEKGIWTTKVHKEANFTAPELTVLTFNVCFTDHYLQERCEALLRIVEGCDADVICLQEVTSAYLKYILNQEWVRANYYVSDYTGGTIQRYGVLLLSRIPIVSLMLHDLPSIMGRKLLVAELRINNQIVKIATVHLESGGKLYAFARAPQLELIFSSLANSKQAILMGDFNFCSSWREENAKIDRNYQDMWAVLRSGEPGYTEDTDINLMRLEYTQKHKKVRFDRILVRSSTPGWQPKSIELLGTNPISSDYPNVFPSDHFGLVGRLEWC